MKLAIQNPHIVRRVERPSSTRRSRWWVVCCVGIWVGCGDDGTLPAPTESRPAQPETPTDSHTTSLTPKATETPKVSQRPKSATVLAARVVAEHAVLSQRQQDLIVGFDSKLTEEIGRVKASRKLFKAVYDGHEGALVFSDGQSLSESVNVLLQKLRELPSHGLNTDKYNIEEAEALILAAQLASEPHKTLKASPPDGKPQKILAILDTLSPETPITTIETTLLDAGLTDNDLAALDAAMNYQTALYESKKKLNDALIAADAGLMNRFFRYLIDFKYGKVAHPFRAMRKPESAWEAFHKKLLADFKETNFSELEAEMRSFWPKNPLYEKTRIGLAFYEKLAQETPQATVPNKTLKKGHHGDSVIQLQTRLAQEGYFSGSLTGHFDEDTETAVRRYQETHQLDVDGIVAAGTVRSLNVPWARRAEQVGLSLQRWRESDTRDLEGFYIRVNIPQFEAEFWENDTLVRKHRVVVGSNAWEKDPERGIEGYLNRTMLFTDEMELIVLNPLWHVPKRIKETELDKELEKTPDFYEKHNYTIKTLPDGTQQVYQNSGPGNALGQVKFLFPNEYAIYLHDTPKKHLFKNTLRAYSHGCMRVENPLDLAEFLLDRDGSLTPEELKKTLKTNRERGIRLKSTIPVVIEYNTVSVSDDGHMMFLFDVYGYDKDFVEGRVPLPKHKIQALDG